ncbi:hypothetical protein AB0F15_18175 [Amycolatopsis sp. NPDC026612]|uniref:hypothetical protein n=1 Tax=Amycolatopsis sp. NPDC026612 TaxID=3155466 RepID=UPI0033C501CA
MGGTEQRVVRSDVVYCALEDGGGFFSTGSIAWSLRRFRDEKPLEQAAAAATTEPPMCRLETQ